jgi:hypothetical protein
MIGHSAEAGCAGYQSAWAESVRLIANDDKGRFRVPLFFRHMEPPVGMTKNDE